MFTRIMDLLGLGWDNDGGGGPRQIPGGLYGSYGGYGHGCCDKKDDDKVLQKTPLF